MLIYDCGWIESVLSAVAAVPTVVGCGQGLCLARYPTALADYLFQSEMDSGFGSFSNAVETYAPQYFSVKYFGMNCAHEVLIDSATFFNLIFEERSLTERYCYAPILGDEGLAHYRERAEEMWQEFPALTSRDTSEGNYQRWKLQRILEALAKTTGDLEDVVAIKRRDLSSSSTYLEIAQLYLQDAIPFG